MNVYDVTVRLRVRAPSKMAVSPIIRTVLLTCIMPAAIRDFDIAEIAYREDGGHRDSDADAAEAA